MACEIALNQSDVQPVPLCIYMKVSFTALYSVCEVETTGESNFLKCYLYN